MPDFGTPFSGLARDRKLTNEELIRAIRFMVAAEYEAIQCSGNLLRMKTSSMRREQRR